MCVGNCVVLKFRFSYQKSLPFEWKTAILFLYLEIEFDRFFDHFVAELKRFGSFFSVGGFFIFCITNFWTWSFSNPKSWNKINYFSITSSFFSAFFWQSLILSLSFSHFHKHFDDAKIALHLYIYFQIETRRETHLNCRRTIEERKQQQKIRHFSG